jgi:exonuclease III
LQRLRKYFKVEALKDLVSLEKPSVILLQETKMEEIVALESAKKALKNNNGLALSSTGASGDILTLWDEKLWQLEVSFRAKHWILTILRNKDFDSKYSFINVYMPNQYSEKLDCWSSLFALKDSIDLNTVIVGGDFNTHLNQGEKKGGNRVRDPFSEKLLDLISNWDLQDIKPLKGRYTWNNRRSGLSHIASRLDRFLISNDFLLSSFDIESCIIPSALSDHKPISLSFSIPQNLGPIPFHFNPLWLDSPIVLLCSSGLVHSCSWLSELCMGK